MVNEQKNDATMAKFLKKMLCCNFLFGFFLLKKTNSRLVHEFVIVSPSWPRTDAKRLWSCWNFGEEF